MKRLTTQEFIEKARLVHGSRYDYSSSVYVNSTVKIYIICPEHGSFEQQSSNHLQGMGCIHCGFKNAGQYHKKNTESFIAEAKSVHGDRYDYSRTLYRGAREQVTIVCRKHGPFEQVAHVHLRGELGSGCTPCSYEKRGESARMSFGEFVSRANEVHQLRYDYTEAESQFIDTASKIAILCPIHGSFFQSPNLHLVGQGCPVCGVARGAAALRKTTESFVSEARAIHGEKYDYSDVEYSGAFENVKIYCPLDGIFLQSPTSHLAGIGCPRCSRRKQGAPRNLTRALRGEFDDSKDAFVYIVTFKLPCTSAQLFKIGSGTGSRMKTVMAEIRRVGGSELTINFLQFSSTGEAIVFEHLAHDQVRQYQFIVPLEYKFPGHSEVFTQCPILVDIENEPWLNRFRVGERWDPRSA
jgi:hypothetical protein